VWGGDRPALFALAGQPDMKVRTRALNPAVGGEIMRAPAFTLAELLVVMGILALLLAIMLPPLQQARRQAQRTHCAAHLQVLGKSLEQARNDHRFYPLWDDGGIPIRYTWIDVLIQTRYLESAGGALLGNRRDGAGKRPTQDGQAVGYCPADELPDLLNEVRHPNLIYPLNRMRNGVDYSYGIGVPLSAGGWAWRGGGSNEPQPRRFRGHDSYTSQRVLAGDAWTSAIYNLSGRAIHSGIWNDPTQYDNTVAWRRHGGPGGAQASANLLFQDGHVSHVGYNVLAEEPVNTARQFVWHPGESVWVGPDDRYEDQFYPCTPPPSSLSNPPGDVFPDAMLPAWYTVNRGWTLIAHK